MPVTVACSHLRWLASFTESGKINALHPPISSSPGNCEFHGMELWVPRHGTNRYLLTMKDDLARQGKL